MNTTLPRILWEIGEVFPDGFWFAYFFPITLQKRQKLSFLRGNVEGIAKRNKRYSQMINKCRIGVARPERAQSLKIFLHLKDVIYGWGVIATIVI